jgi:hypothetical protein
VTYCASRIPSVGRRVRVLQVAGKSADIAGSASAGILDSPRISAATFGMLQLSSRVGQCPGFAGTGSDHVVGTTRSRRGQMSADSHLVRRMTPPGTRR